MTRRFTPEDTSYFRRKKLLYHSSLGARALEPVSRVIESHISGGQGGVRIMLFGCATVIGRTRDSKHGKWCTLVGSIQTHPVFSRFLSLSLDRSLSLNLSLARSLCRSPSAFFLSLSLYLSCSLSLTPALSHSVYLSLSSSRPLARALSLSGCSSLSSIKI